jgi:hypothetical protein
VERALREPPTAPPIVLAEGPLYSGSEWELELLSLFPFPFPQVAVLVEPELSGGLGYHDIWSRVRLSVRAGDGCHCG